MKNAVEIDPFSGQISTAFSLLFPGYGRFSENCKTSFKSIKSILNFFSKLYAEIFFVIFYKVQGVASKSYYLFYILPLKGGRYNVI